jgi:putative aminopeptidase FrvX
VLVLAVGVPRLAVAQQVTFSPLSKEVVLARLRQTAKDNHARAMTLETLLAESGCTAAHLEEQSVKHLKAPNVICTWPGATDQRILISAHTDKVGVGEGAVDDWSGASLLADLFESLHTVPRRHTLVFIGFSGEEEGLVGSRFYVKALTAEHAARIKAEVNIECLGLSPTAVWLSHADRELARFAGQVSAASKLPIGATNVDQVGRDDAMSFAERRIPTITFHSVTQSTLAILHSQSDTYRAIHPDDYYDSYRFLAAYLAFADTALQ